MKQLLTKGGLTFLAMLWVFSWDPAPSPPTLRGPSLEVPSFTPSALAKKKKKKKSKAKAGKSNHLSPKRKGKVISIKFKVPPEIQPAVDFWKMIYSKYDRNYEIFHDTEKLGMVYSVLDFTDLYNNDALTRKERLALFRPRLEAEEDRIIAMLLHIHENQYHPEVLSKEERRIYEKFKDDPNPNKFKDAANPKRVRAQTGIKNKFVEAIQTSGAYIEEFEDIFMSYGLPIELTRLAFVESMFNTQARSKVGASGLWQFMPSTGKLFGLSINKYVDERNDPILATHAAARLLQSNYEALGTWPLAINAYNSGRATMHRAVAATGTTDIGTIIVNYRGGVYQFASRNFYPSFLAALEVANNYPKYFGKIPRDQKLKYETYVVQNSVYFGELAAAAGVNSFELMEYNPHFSDGILNDRVKIPVGYALRIPHGTAAQFAQAELTAAQSYESVVKKKRR
jgi:membrane-bound lytic murein transglycosylase D